jgi:hypothetical protein
VSVFFPLPPRSTPFPNAPKGANHDA